MNGFSAADMSTAAANGHAEGYQAGYSDAVKAVEAGKDAAAQEAVGWQFWHNGEWRYGSPDHVVRDHRKNTEAAGIPVRDVYAAPVAAAPIDSLETTARRMFEQQADPLAAPWDRQWEPTKAHWRKIAAKASTAAAPGIDLEQFRDAVNYWFAKCSLTFGPVSVGRIRNEAKRLLALIDASPKGGSFDVDLFVRNALLQLREDALHMKDPGDTVNAYDRVLRLIDASPKGGSTDSPVCFISPLDAHMLRSREKTLRWTGTYWEKKHDDMVPVYLGTPTAMQATSAEGDSTDAEPKIWGTQKPGSMPKLFGALHIAQLNWYPDEGRDLVCMQVIERVQATSAEVGA